jgi:hypothetical protein
MSLISPSYLKIYEINIMTNEKVSKFGANKPSLTPTMSHETTPPENPFDKLVEDVIYIIIGYLETKDDVRGLSACNRRLRRITLLTCWPVSK